MARKGLGRGLEAILGEEGQQSVSTDPTPRASGVRKISVGDIAPDPDQPRKHFDDEALEELASSLRTHGMLQPILIRPNPSGSGYFIIAGERRWRAAQRAELHEIPSLIREETDGVTAELALIENVQRSDLNPMEEADAYARLRDVHGKKASEIADTVGKSRSHIANMLRLVSLPASVRAYVVGGELSMGHARALLSAQDPEGLAEHVVKGGLSVRETEKAAQGPKISTPRKGAPEKPDDTSGKPAPTSAGKKDADTRSLESDLEAMLGLSVAIEHTKKGGAVTLTYDTLDQLDDICRRLMGTTV